MLLTKNPLYLNDPQKRTAELVLHGTFLATTILGCLLIAYDGIVQSVWFGGRSWVILLVFLYLFLSELILRKGYYFAVCWLLIAFYLFLSFCTLAFWGLNAPVGILTVSFAIVLPSILIGSKAILPVVCLSVVTLLTVQIIHQSAIISPNIILLSKPSTFWDVMTYSTILSIFALVSWLAGRQREKNLRRALMAESELRAQKELLRTELNNESSKLRLTQLNQIRQLHKFALLGQTTAATLHELSNHLSILNLDIDDLRQQNSNSKAILNATDSISRINTMVKQVRQQLTTYDKKERFNAIAVINRNVKDLKLRFSQKNIKFDKMPIRGKRTCILHGSPIALMQIITILLNNAVEACSDIPNPKIKLQIDNSSSKLVISIIDNGKGIDSKIAKSLFRPLVSTKSSGLGVGLYIAQHLAQDQFEGKIRLIKSKVGAHFEVVIPI